ncbi:MAG: hypothetical protein QM484_06995 [Woeseiaceae bacterium]
MSNYLIESAAKPDLNNMSYTLINKYSDYHVHLKFDGFFLNNEVVWDTHFYTLDGFYAEAIKAVTNPTQFIQVNKTNDNLYQLKIALKVERITPPNIEKMMIMIKQYKNLKLGHYEYG